MFRRNFIGNIKTHVLCSATFSENRAVYETVSKNMVEPNRQQMTTRRMRVACWISKAIHANVKARARTHTHTHALTLARARTQKYIIFIAFPQQQLLRERVSVRYTYIACLVLG